MNDTTTTPGQDPEAVARDFVARYQQSPSSITKEEALKRYQSVAPQLSPAVHTEAAQEAFSHLSQPERLALGNYLISQAQQQGIRPPDGAFPDLNGDGIDDRTQDPKYLAQVAEQGQQQQPGWLGRILGEMGVAGGGSKPGASQGNFPGGTLGKVALGGVAVAALSRLFGGGFGGGGFGGGGHGGGHGGRHGGGH